MAASSAIIGQAEKDFDLSGTKKTSGGSEMGRDDFLTLLVAQISHQDPLNPMEDKEFTSQLAEFSSLEQLTKISEGVDTMNTGSSRQEMLGAVSFIGKQVRADGYTLSKEGNNVSTLYFDLDEPMAGGYINVFDSSGGLVRTDPLGAAQPGSYEYIWDGKDYNGNAMSDGVYFTAMAAEGTSGQPVLISTDVSGVVAGVQTDGTTQFLRLSDGRMVNFIDIKEVVNPESLPEESVAQ
jgi:flagellar basal-body rod modification protein FlgD